MKTRNESQLQQPCSGEKGKRLFCSGENGKRLFHRHSDKVGGGHDGQPLSALPPRLHPPSSLPIASYHPASEDRASWTCSNPSHHSTLEMPPPFSAPTLPYFNKLWLFCARDMKRSEKTASALQVHVSCTSPRSNETDVNVPQTHRRRSGYCWCSHLRTGITGATALRSALRNSSVSVNRLEGRPFLAALWLHNTGVSLHQKNCPTT